MNPLSKHLRFFMRGWLLAIITGSLAAIITLATLNPQGSLEESLSHTGVFFISFWLGMLLFGVILAYNAWRKYVRTTATIEASEVLGSVANSKDSYCLILRPFGYDGSTILPRWSRVGSWSPALTLEQVVALAIRRSIGIKTYAMVDQEQQLAPPGPVYLRSPHAEWRDVIAKLLDQAHHILLLLPPVHNLGESFGWELEQIAQKNLQSKVIAVLPPWDKRDAGRHTQARDHVCVILAALEGFAGSIDNADPLKVLHYDRVLPSTVLVVKFRETDELIPQAVLHWSVRTIRNRRKRCGYVTYARAITKALKT